VERKMMINALNSGARVFMADLEDALSPTWNNVIEGQDNLRDAVRRTLTFTNPEGKQYRLNNQIATLLMRPRGWHLTEKHVLIEGEPISASLFDFGLYFFHNARELLDRGSGPYFYLPKLESHLEARLWNDVFNFAQDALDIRRGTIRATVLIETVLAAFEMDEILYELREHAAGLNAGRWDYIFSIIKKFRNQPGLTLPDRSQITMTVPFMRAYTELLVKTCHKRGAHAIGGMAAFIPNRKDAQVTENALAKVREDKVRESRDGFDGTWVAHPDLVPLATETFDQVLGEKPHQKDRLRDEVQITAEQLRTIHVPGGTLTEAGITNNISVALQYIEAWLGGNGAVAINNLMEDAATAEIARAQLWLWLHQGAQIELGTPFDKSLYEKIKLRELGKLADPRTERFYNAERLLDRLVLNDTFTEFLTLIAGQYLN
jgi:malate synthase